MIRPTMHDLIRFLDRRAIGPNCWEWIGGRHRMGYGVLYVCGKDTRATRLAWFFAHDRWPMPGELVRHKCDNPGCVRPDHLELGTHADNMKDMVDRDRNQRGSAKRDAKLNEAQVVLIRADTRKLRVIAEEYGISDSGVSRIKTRKIWRHVP